MTITRDSTRQWRKSTRCGSSACVEVAFDADGTAHLRDSKNPDQTPLTFDAAEWAAFTAGVQAGEFTPGA